MNDDITAGAKSEPIPSSDTTHADPQSPSPRINGSAPPRRSDSFRQVLARTVALLDERLSGDEIAALSGAFTTMCWDFPDVRWQAWLGISRDPPEIRLESRPGGSGSLRVTMNSTVLHAAAVGESSLGMAFLSGRLLVQGLNPLSLAKFVKLIDPLLASYRAALEEHHESSR